MALEDHLSVLVVGTMPSTERMKIGDIQEKEVEEEGLLVQGIEDEADRFKEAF